MAFERKTIVPENKSLLAEQQIKDESKEQEGEIRRVEVVSESTFYRDQWDVKYKLADQRYIWGRLNDAEEMNRFHRTGYIPATGNEEIYHNPYTENPKPKPGEKKIMGNRILMRCPMKDYLARKQAELARTETPKEASKSAARSIRKKAGKDAKYFGIEAIGETEKP